jgi:hypothetical protein
MDVQISPDSEEIPKLYDNINTKAGKSLQNLTNNVFSGIDPINMIIFFTILLFFIFIFNNLGSETQSQPQVSNSGIEIIMYIVIGLFVFLLFTNGLQYIFEFDIKAFIKNVFTPKTEVEIELKKRKSLKGKGKSDTSFNFIKEVFHVPGNKYTYSDADAVCKAFGSRLATYDEIDKAYNKGGEWCSYGWSNDQLALFPTQESTYNTLRGIKGHENDCGRPGINGGYIKNPNVRFGVNCFGHKPKITPEEKQLMSNMTTIPLTPEEKELDNKTKYYKSKLKDILIAPFNKNTWTKM